MCYNPTELPFSAQQSYRTRQDLAGASLDTQSLLLTSAECMYAVSGRDGSKGPISFPQSESDRRLLLELGITRNKGRLKLLNVDRGGPMKTNKSCNTCFQDAAATDAQLTITVMFNSTALRTTGQCAHAYSKMIAHTEQGTNKEHNTSYPRSCSATK
jgi:hypothetical protein